MTFQIVEQNGNAVVEIPCEEKIAAQVWAMDWAKSKASADEYLIKQDGNDCAKLFHTAGGQWYLMNA
ncbi:hypothetical protein FHS92_000703 [Sphingobium subterraneum]|uniref:Uncharacterized protein n=2 Tax=Sphingobium subterraneum TaxID=627688 RepID=A0A841J0E4_9SPHN|nr:hypothetical protein [Sphingobium subterraneum]